MLQGIRKIVEKSGIEACFAADEEFIEAKCDYCTSAYQIYRAELTIH